MRTLPYRLLFNRNIVQELIREGDASNRVFFLSDEEILTIRSALQRGADLTYPEISDSIMHWLDDMIEICSAVQECIENDTGVQAALNDLIAGGTQIPASSPYGQPLSSERLEQDLSTASNPGCGFNILWGQCAAIVDFTNSEITDTLQKVEAASNAAELAKATLGTIPVEAGLEKAAGIDGALEMVNYYQEAIAEEYAAQYTTTPVTGTRDIIAFDIFCACKSDCIITIERVQAVMQARIEVYLSPPSIEGLVNLAEFLAGVEQDSSFVVDLAFFASWTMLAVSNYFFGGVGNNILDLVVALAADEPDNGWEFMGDCPAEWEHRFDFTIDEQGWLADGGYGTYTSGVGWNVSGLPQISLHRTFSENQITAMRWETDGGTGLFQPLVYPSGEGFVQGNEGGGFLEDFTIDLSANAAYASITGVYARVTQDGAQDYTPTLIAITLSGYGIEPEW